MTYRHTVTVTYQFKGSDTNITDRLELIQCARLSNMSLSLAVAQAKDKLFAFWNFLKFVVVPEGLEKKVGQVFNLHFMASVLPDCDGEESRRNKMALTNTLLRAQVSVIGDTVFERLRSPASVEWAATSLLHELRTGEFADQSNWSLGPVSVLANVVSYFVWRVTLVMLVTVG